MKAGIDQYGAYISSPHLPRQLRGFAIGPTAVVAADAAPDEIAHETRHRKQFFAPGWSLLKLIDAFYPYDEKPTERDAFRHAHPQLESQAPRGVVSRTVDSYLRGLLGE